MAGPDRPTIYDIDTIVAPNNKAFQELKQNYLRKNYIDQSAWKKILSTHLLKKSNDTLVGVGNDVHSYKFNVKSFRFAEVDGIPVTSEFSIKVLSRYYTLLLIDGLLVPKDLPENDEAEIFKA